MNAPFRELWVPKLPGCGPSAISCPQQIATGGRADLHRVQPFVEVSDKEVTYGVCIVHQAETGYSNQTRYYGCIKDRYRLVTYGKGPELEFTRFPADDGGQYAQFQFHGEPQKNLWTDFDRETWVTKQIGFVCEARIRKAYPLAQETADRIAEKARQELEFVRESAGNQK